VIVLLVECWNAIYGTTVVGLLDQVKLGNVKAKYFHRTVAMMLYVTKRARPDTALSVAFLTTQG